MLPRCALFISKCYQGVHYLSANVSKVCTIYQQMLSRCALFISKYYQGVTISKCYQGVHCLSANTIKVWLFISECHQGVHYLSASVMKVCTIYQQVLSSSALSKCYQVVHYLSTSSYLSISSIVDVWQGPKYIFRGAAGWGGEVEIFYNSLGHCKWK